MAKQFLPEGARIHAEQRPFDSLKKMYRKSEKHESTKRSLLFGWVIVYLERTHSLHLKCSLASKLDSTKVDDPNAAFEEEAPLNIDDNS